MAPDPHHSAARLRAGRVVTHHRVAGVAPSVPRPAHPVSTVAADWECRDSKMARASSSALLAITLSLFATAPLMAPPFSNSSIACRLSSKSL
eukprot:CAMPEP_0174938684 /NCGR_PEP_ID=MMETSP1355-20121228/64259_1 /TAXON_ID=464990 /ORGANISM="Hemiselmis tepida, Strain CCMP443" /LENGTH=91 /DNA_ID=CAMNT_0016185633 /DNA_START=136 /DNA_END=408 /DNA_ORIENTATION=-